MLSDFFHLLPQGKFLMQTKSNVRFDRSHLPGGIKPLSICHYYETKLTAQLAEDNIEPSVLQTLLQLAFT